MQFPNYFADAETSFQTASFILVGIPYEKTSSFRHGADKAPEEIRQASWNFERFDLHTKINYEKSLRSGKRKQKTEEWDCEPSG